MYNVYFYNKQSKWLPTFHEKKKNKRCPNCFRIRNKDILICILDRHAWKSPWNFKINPWGFQKKSYNPRASSVTVETIIINFELTLKIRKVWNNANGICKITSHKRSYIHQSKDNRITAISGSFLSHYWEWTLYEYF